MDWRTWSVNSCVPLCGVTPVRHCDDEMDYLPKSTYHMYVCWFGPRCSAMSSVMLWAVSLQDVRLWNYPWLPDPLWHQLTLWGCKSLDSRNRPCRDNAAPGSRPGHGPAIITERAIRRNSCLLCSADTFSKHHIKCDSFFGLSLHVRYDHVTRGVTWHCTSKIKLWKRRTWWCLHSNLANMEFGSLSFFFVWFWFLYLMS